MFTLTETEKSSARIQPVDPRHSQLNDLLQNHDAVYGGCYPIRQEGISDDVLRRETRRKLEAKGIPQDLQDVVVCASPEEKLRLIIQDREEFNRSRGKEGIVIVDEEPQTLLTTARKILLDGTFPRETLEQVTLIEFSVGLPFQTVDANTGIRHVRLPPSVSRFSTHPNPAS